MRKLFFATAIVSLASFYSANAQSFEVGSNVVNAGIGFGSSILDFSQASASPAFSATYERGIWKAGPGVVSLGAYYVGFESYKYGDQDGNL